MEAYFDLAQNVREACYGHADSCSRILTDYNTNDFLGLRPEYACVGLQLLSKLLCCTGARGAVHPWTTKNIRLQSRKSL